MDAQSQESRIVIHVDMDAFYAAVEELDRPEYRGKPLVVGADPKEGKGRGVVSTANYAARKYGIHSAMPISQAYRRCPQAIYLRGNYARYAEVSRQVMAILKSYSPAFMQISIDEAFLDVTSTMHRFGNLKALATDLKQRVRAETGLTASVGAGPNMFVAKVASDLQKPDGLTICPADEAKAFLAPLPLKRLWGVGPKTEARLRHEGFTNIGEIAQCSRDYLAQRFGKWGAHLWELANGIDHRPVEDRGERKSISQEHTFDVDVDDLSLLEQRLWRIADDLSTDMRRLEIKGRTITLKIRLEGFLTFTRSKTIAEPTNDTELIRALALRLFRAFDRQGKRVRLVGLGLSDLNTHDGAQLELFADSAAGKQEKLGKLLDSVREKFGGEAVTRASLMGNADRNWGREDLPERQSPVSKEKS